MTENEGYIQDLKKFTIKNLPDCSCGNVPHVVLIENPVVYMPDKICMIECVSDDCDVQTSKHKVKDNGLFYLACEWAYIINQLTEE